MIDINQGTGGWVINLIVQNMNPSTGSWFVDWYVGVPEPFQGKAQGRAFRGEDILEKILSLA